MLRKFWLLFAQACTLCVAALFVVATLRPDLLPRLAGKNNRVVLLQQAGGTIAAPGATSYAEAARKAMPAVVNIYSSKAVRSRNPLLDDDVLKRYFPDLAQRIPARQATSLGSGVIVSPDGYVLTNHHVVDGADDIELVLADGRELHAKVRGVDPESDLAVLKTDGENLPTITFGSMDDLHVGDVVLAIGNPFGFGNTVTMGIVSALGRNHLGVNRFEDFIQTDAPINPGNSGGALVDTSGRLIGINSAILSRGGGSEGIGFAIPIDLAQKVIASLRKNGRVARGWLGISTMNAPGGEPGAVVAAVEPGAPAARAGIERGDVIVGFAGHKVRQPEDLAGATLELEPGTHVALDIVRDGRHRNVDVALGTRPPLRAATERR